MHVYLCDTPEIASREAAAHIIGLVRKTPAAKLGLATGSTPLRLYAALVEAHRSNVSFSRVVTFNLDEYIGLPPDHPQSYRRFMDEHLFSLIALDPARTHVPDGLAVDIPAACAAYEHAIRAAGGIDLQILGIGGNGHIGFNEPGAGFDSRTRCVALTPQTLLDNARFFASPDLVPRQAISMGIATILEARRCVLLGFGENKARAVRDALEGPATPACPASALQTHPDAWVYLDQAAASALRQTDRYHRLSIP